MGLRSAWNATQYEEQICLGTPFLILVGAGIACVSSISDLHIGTLQKLVIGLAFYSAFDFMLKRRFRQLEANPPAMISPEPAPDARTVFLFRAACIGACAIATAIIVLLSQTISK